MNQARAYAEKLRVYGVEKEIFAWCGLDAKGIVASVEKALA